MEQNEQGTKNKATTPQDKGTRQPQDVRGLFPIGNFWQGKWGLLLFAALVIGTIFILRRSSNKTWHEAGGKIFGTQYAIKYCHDTELDRDILAVLDSVDNSMSLFKPTSTLSRINGGADTAGTADAMLLEVLTLSQKISAETDGAFDVTVAPLVKLWGFGPDKRRAVSAAQVDSLRPFIGWQKLQIDGTRVRKARPEVMIDCGAVAKGYAVDCVARMLQRKGVRDFMVEIGGEVCVSGQNSKQKTWTIGVQKPIEGSEADEVAPQAVLTLPEGAVATSGNYRNFYELNGHKYAHTIDPKSGNPVQHTLLSATVIAPDCATADAYATAFMVLGIDRAKQVLSRHPELSAYFIYEEGGRFKAWKSEKLQIEE